MSLLLIVVCFVLSGFLLSRCILYFLIFRKRSATTPVNILSPYSGELGDLIASGVMNDETVKKLLSGEDLLQKLRPDISNHIDHFLNVKLKQVFPLLAQFMGDKTRNQLKSAFMDEMDRLFPEVMGKLHEGMLNREKISAMVTQKISSFNPGSGPFAGLIKKKIQPWLDLFCCGFMFIAGILTALLHHFLT